VDALLAQLMLEGDSISTAGLANFSTACDGSVWRELPSLLKASPLTLAGCLPRSAGSMTEMKSDLACKAAALCSTCCRAAASLMACTNWRAPFNCATASLASICVPLTLAPLAGRAVDEQQAFAAAHHAPGIAAHLETLATVAAALGARIGLLDQMAQVEL
jgi:hypothetical protein